MSVTSSADPVEQVWLSFRSRLRRYLGARVSRPDDADDLVQEVMERLIHHRERLGEVRSVSGWVWSITRNVLADHHRAAARRREEPTANPPERGAVVGDSAESARSDLARCMDPLVGRLSPALRAAVELVDLQGVSQVDAARRLGISVPATKSRVQRGRAALLAMLTECCAVAVDARNRPIATEGGDCVPGGSECGPGTGPRRNPVYAGVSPGRTKPVS